MMTQYKKYDVSAVTSGLAKSIAIRMDQQIRVCIKPKPRYLSERTWLKLAAIFIQIEKTQPRFSVVDKNANKKA